MDTVVNHCSCGCVRGSSGESVATDCFLQSQLGDVAAVFCGSVEFVEYGSELAVFIQLLSSHMTYIGIRLDTVCCEAYTSLLYASYHNYRYMVKQ